MFILRSLPFTKVVIGCYMAVAFGPRSVVSSASGRIPKNTNLIFVIAVVFRIILNAAVDRVININVCEYVAVD